MTRKFEAIISILDRASAPLLAIEDKMRNLGSRAKKTEVEIKEIGATSLLHARIGQDIHAIGAKLHGVGASIHHHLGGPLEKVGHVVEKIVEAVPIIGSIGGLGSAAGIVALINRTAEATEQLSNLSNITGISTVELQKLQFAAKDSGVSTDELARGMGRLNERLGKAALGQNKQLAALFAHLHVSLRNADGSVKSAAQQLPVLMKALHDTHNPALRAAIVMAAFGRSGVDLLPFLDKGSTKLAEQTKRWKEFGYTFTGGDLDGLDQFRHSWNDLETAVGGFLSQVASDFAPVMAPVIKQMAVFVAQNRGLISADLKNGLLWIENQFKKNGSAIKTFGDDAKAAFEVLIQSAKVAAAVLKPIAELIQIHNKNYAAFHSNSLQAKAARNSDLAFYPSAARIDAIKEKKQHNHAGPGAGGTHVEIAAPKKPRYSGLEAYNPLRFFESSGPGQSRGMPAAAPHEQVTHKVALTLHITAPPGVTVTPKSVVGATVPRASLGHNGTVMELHTP